MNTIKIRNIGTIQHLELPIPKDGGIVVLRGRNGSGKSTALQTVETTLTGFGRLAVADNEDTGSAEVCGVTLRVGRQQRRTGQLLVDTLTGRFSIADLVNPGIQDPNRADAARIKALLLLAGASITPETFIELGPEAVQAAQGVDDPVEAGRRIKSQLEDLARLAETAASEASIRAASFRQQIKGVELGEAIDQHELQARLTAAIQHNEALKAQTAESNRTAEIARRAADALAALHFDPNAIEEATGQMGTAELIEQNCHRQVELLEDQLRQAKVMAAEANNTVEQARRQLQHVEQQALLVASWQRQIQESQAQDPPTDAEQEAAALKVLNAQRAIEDAAVARQALLAADQAKQADRQAETHRKSGEDLRQRAQRVDGVLSGLVATLSGPLRVEKGRLVTDTTRGPTAYGELSPGERWAIAVAIGIRAVGRNGIIVLPQEAYEGLDPANRQAIANQVRGSGVVILTAECSSDPVITSEVL